MAAGDPEPKLAGWLDTVSADTRSSLGGDPQTTIVPNRGAEESWRRAFSVLEQLGGASSLASAQLRPGEEIGRGGMGVIREAEQVALGRTVAIKTLRPDNRDAGSALDLLREAWITGSLEHPNIVPVHHVGLDSDGKPLIVLKRIEGVEWSAVLRDTAEVRRRFGASDLLAWNVGILMQVLNAIRFAHSRGILHRDLKPANVMIGDYGEVYVLDWGIAVSLLPDPSGRLPLAADAQQIAGTPSYMAPEMLDRAGVDPLSERTDVYLAGAVLYELLAGRPPHLAASAVAVMTSVMQSRPELPTKTPAELAAICRRAMHPEPAHRFESAEALRLALQGYLEHRGSDVLASRARERLDLLRSALASPTSDHAHDREEAYRLFGACRFGFHEALAAWPENRDAHAGLVDATIALAEYDLAHDDPRAAVSLLGELDEPPPLLETARAAAAAHATRHAELEKLERDHDPDVGESVRVAVGVAIGVVFTVVPAVMAAVPRFDMSSHAVHFGAVLALAVGVAALAWWLRGLLGTSLINRRLVATIPFVFGVQVVLAGLCWRVGIPVAETQMLMLFTYGVACGVVSITMDAGLGASAIAYLLACLLAARWPSMRLYLMSASNFALALTVVARRHKDRPAP